MRSFTSNKGSVLIVALIFSAIIAIALTSYLKLSISAVKLANRSFYLNAAHNLADSGLERALWTLNDDIVHSLPTNWTYYGDFAGRAGFSSEYQGTFPSSSTYYTLSGGAKGQVKVWVGDYVALSDRYHAVAKATITLGDGTTLMKMSEAY